jgi:hypothetical protein
MKKISLIALGVCFCFLSLFSQKKVTRDTAYVPKPLRTDEVNLVSGYYTQDGNHSAVTGGIGTEKLTDYANTFDIRWLKPGQKGQKHFINLEMGVDHYTSASSDKIDTTARGGGGHGGPPQGGGGNMTSASYKDTRFYPTIGYQVEGLRNGISLGAAVSYSTEWDYISKGLSLNFSKSSKNKNREFAIRVGMFLDSMEIILPAELRVDNGQGGGGQGGPGGGRDRGPRTYQGRNTFNAAFTFSQVINRKLQMAVILEPTYQKGILATKYQRVYFTDGSVQPENLPDTRTKFPLGFRASYFATEKIVLRPYYRFYADSWGLIAQTISLEAAFKVSNSFSVSPFYRFYTQNGIKNFNEFGTTLPNAAFFTSDYDLAKLTSHQIGAGFRWSPKYGVLDMKHFNSIELRYAHYERSTDLKANIWTLALKFR